MTYNAQCFHCTKKSPLDDFMIKIADLNVSQLYLFKEQTHPGRCLVSFNGHKNELFELTDDEKTAFMNDLAQAANAIQQAFQPDNINYGAFSDNLAHLHFHLVPKYKDGPSWGGMFEMSPAVKTLLTDAQYQERIKQLQQYL